MVQKTLMILCPSTVRLCPTLDQSEFIKNHLTINDNLVLLLQVNLLLSLNYIKGSEYLTHEILIYSPSCILKSSVLLYLTKFNPWISEKSLILRKCGQ